MNSEAIKSMMNPLRLKIVQEISLKGTATTKEIAEICGDIPQATLYRHLNSLLKHGIIEVVSENKVRGILEKVYKIKSNPTEHINRNPEELTKDELSELFSQFIISLLCDFNNYLYKGEEVNPVEDMIGFRSYPLYLSDEEFVEMLGEISTSIRKRLENKPSKDRILRKLSTVTTPYKQERIEEIE
jgi:DNA-binding transcriptional ArsR family regulator